MTKVLHDDIHRRVWMFPRNIRSIFPWKMAQILSMLQMQLEDDVWSGNQSLQNKFIKNLERFNLKSPGAQYDPHSGGARTYFAQLESLGLVFKRNDKTTWLTIAGQDLADSTSAPAEIIRKQLFNYQYPSVYSKKKNVKMHPDIKIKPFLFILELLIDKEIQYMTDYEIIIPVLYGHNHESFAECKNKILKLRETRNLFDIIDNEDEDLFTPRTRDRNPSQSIDDFKNIANTCKCYLESCSLVFSHRIKGSRSKRITVNEGFLPEIKKALKSKDKFIPLQNDESFQRRFGAWNRRKDTRRLVRGITKVSHGEPIIHALFAEYAGKNLVFDIPQELIDIAVGYGFKEKFVTDTVEPLLVHSLSYFEQKFMSMSSGGATTSIDFEKAVQKLFQECLFYKSTHTGQRHRPGKKGGYSDIFIQELSGRICAIIDTKASPRYTLPSSDYYTMEASYIPSIVELAEYKGEELGFSAYVAGGFVDTIDETIKDMNSLSGNNYSAIKAYDLLKLSQQGIPSSKQNEISDIFMTNKLLTINDFKSLFP